MHKKTIGILGGSFDPPHIGHIELANFAKNYVDEVGVIPCGHRNDKPKMASYDIRLNMCRAAFKHLWVYDIEKGSHMIPTFNLMKTLEDLYQELKFFFIIGKDLLLSLDSGHNSERLVNEVNFLVFNRPGYELSEQISNKYLNKSNFLPTKDNFNINVSSTAIRRIVESGENFEFSETEKKMQLNDLVHIEEVSEIIVKNGLYLSRNS